MTDKRIRIILDSKQAEKNAKDLDGSVKGIGKSADQTAFSMNKLASAIKSAIIAAGAISAIKSIAAIGDEYAKITGLLKLATDNQDEFNFALAESKHVAEATRAPLAQTVETYAALERSTKSLNKSQKEIFSVLETVNKSIALTSPAAESAAASLTQFGQALGGDFKAGAQELNSILEQTPGLAIAIADGLGVPVSSLKALGEAGELSAEKVFRALEKISDEVDEKFTQIPQTIGSATTLIKNDLLVALGDSKVSQPLIDSLNDLRATLADPAVKDGIVSIASALVTLTKVLAESASGFADFGKDLAFVAASVTGNVSPLEALERQIKAIDESVGKSRLFAEEFSFVFMSDEQLKEERLKIQGQINLITGGFAQIQSAKQAAMPDIKFNAPDIKSPDLNIKQLLNAGYEQEEKDRKQHFENMKDIDKEFWDSVESEGKQRDADTEIMNRQKNNTDTLRAELETRTLISRQAAEGQYSYLLSDYQRELVAIQNQQNLKTAELQKSIEAENQTRANQRANELDFYQKNKLDDSALRDEFLEQDKIIAQTHEEELFTIRQEGINARAELDRAEYQARLASVGQLGEALISLGQGQSKKIFKIGQTLALAQAAVALPTAVMESFKNGGGYPWGLIPAAAMLATGIKNIQQIKSAGGSLGGGGGGSVPTPSLGGGSMGSGPSIPSTSGTTEAFKQKQVIEIRGVSPDSLITGAQLAEILQRDDNVIVALSGAQQDAQRRGVI